MFNDNLKTRKGRIPLVTLALFALATASAGCTARVDTVHPVAADEVYVDSTPYIATAPRAVYQGQTVYYVDGHWYRPRGRGWAYYRDEPPELRRHRPYVQAAPPAYRHYGYGGGPRPVAPAGPPEAVRVR
jgi:hypothetical protein